MAEHLQERIENGSLTELMEMCGHLLHHRPEVMSARGQQRILMILVEQECLSQRQLQEMLRIQPGSMSEILTKLERKGLLMRERGEDRRGNLLRITEAGRRAVAEVAPAQDENLFSSLTAEQQKQLKSLLQPLLKDWIHSFDRRTRGSGDR